MKKSVRIRLICLIVATVILGGAVTAAAIMGSPYETAKKAVLDALTYRNATAELNLSATVNGKIYDSEKTLSIIGDKCSLNYSYDENGDLTYYVYDSDLFSVSPMSNDFNGEKWFNATIYPADRYMYNTYSSSFAMFSAEDRDSAQMRFIELLIDTLVGDLKNNITMTSENGVRYISGTLTSSQVPELVKAGLDVLVEQSGNYYGYQNELSFNGTEYIYEQVSIERSTKTAYVYKQTVQMLTGEERQAYETGIGWEMLGDKINKWWVTYIGGDCYYVTGEELISTTSAPATRDDYNVYNDNPFDLPMQSLVINYVRGDAQVDSNGNLTFLELSGAATVTDVFGNVNEIDIKGTVNFSDVGTSNPVCPVPGAEQVLVYDKLKERFGTDYGYIYAYFKLNADGTIDEDSITTMYPGETYSPKVYERSVRIESYDYPVGAPLPAVPALPADPDAPAEPDEGL